MCSAVIPIFSSQHHSRVRSSYETSGLLSVNDEELKSGESAHPSSCSVLTGLCPDPFFHFLSSVHSLDSRREQVRQLSHPCSGQGSWQGWHPCGWGWALPFWQHWVAAEGHGLVASHTPLMKESCHIGAWEHIHAGWMVTWSPRRSAGCPWWSCVPLKHGSWEGVRPLWEEIKISVKKPRLTC